MHVRLLSDLHFELHDDVETFISSLDLWEDVCILAGDIVSVAAPQMEQLESLFIRHPNVQFLWVPGNHEYYTRSIPLVDHQMDVMAATHDNLHIMKRQIFRREAWTFVGATLWYPPQNLADFVGWSDHTYIQNPGRIFFEAGLDAAFLENCMTSVNTVVITHMLPHEACINPKYHGNPCNKFFLHDQSDLIRRLRPKFWVFGHTHSAIDTTVDGCRMICNPRGNPGEAGTNFNQFCNFELEPASVLEGLL